jgi:hypothetical protein
MADLLKLAKEGKVVDFEKEWAKNNSKTYPLSTTDGAAATAEYDRLRKYDTGSVGANRSKVGGTNLVETVESLFKSQESGKKFESLETEMIGVSDFFDTFYDRSTQQLRSLGDIGKTFVKGIVDNIGLYFDQQTALLEKVNTETSLTGQLSKDFREEITNANPRLLQLGISFGELSESATQLVTQTGRFNLINQQTFERAGEVAKAYVGSLQDLVKMYPEFEKVGIGAADAQEKIADAGKRSLELGLNSKTVTSALEKNLGKLNEFGFRNGVRGLEEMTRKSIEFRSNMEDVTRIADKVFSPEGAIDFAANLQVIGGVMGDFNDPLKLMYMATNNVEGLQDALIDAAGSLATYNSEQGRFEITGVNLRRAKAMASELGMTLGDLSKTAIAAAERTSASSDLIAQGLTLDEDQQRFITNLAQMKGGRMTIELQSEFLKEQFGKNEIALEDLDQNQANLLVRYQNEFKKLTDNEIVRNQATSIENIKRDVNFVAAYLRIQGGRGVETAAELAGFDLKEVAKETQQMGKKSAEWLDSMGKELKSKLGIDINLKSNTIFNEPTNSMTTEKQRQMESDKNKQNQQQQPQQNNGLSFNDLERVLDNFSMKNGLKDKPNNNFSFNLTAPVEGSYA